LKAVYNAEGSATTLKALYNAEGSSATLKALYNAEGSSATLKALPQHEDTQGNQALSKSACKALTRVFNAVWHMT
jgi:hypothetical protein